MWQTEVNNLGIKTMVYNVLDSRASIRINLTNEKSYSVSTYNKNGIYCGTVFERNFDIAKLKGVLKVGDNGNRVGYREFICNKE